MKDNNYYVVHGWMLNSLQLRGNELLIFAIIYGFSQDGDSRFSGTMRYLWEATGSTHTTVIKVLKSLQEKGLIVKHKKRVNGIIVYDYSINDETLSEVKKLYPLGKETLPTYNKENKEKKLTKKEEKFRSELDQFKDKYPPDLLDQFFHYWTEPNKSKTMLRWELQPTWDLPRRLATWKSNQSKFTKPGKDPSIIGGQHPHKIIKQRMNGSSNSIVRKMNDNYQTAAKLIASPNRAQLSNNLCFLYDWIQEKRPKDAMAKTEHSEDIKTPESLISEYVWWLEHETWIKGVSESTFTPDSKLFKNFLTSFEERIGLDPLTGGY